MKRLLVILMIIISILVVIFGVSKLWARKATMPDRITLNNVVVDKNYLLALNSVDQFLCAWLNRSQQQGVQFITDRLRNSLTDDQLFAFFVGTSNPHHQGFEIIGAKRVSNERIRFYVWLYEYTTASNPPPVKRGKPSFVDVVKVNEFIWKVDTLPQPVR